MTRLTKKKLFDAIMNVKDWGVLPQAVVLDIMGHINRKWEKELAELMCQQEIIDCSDMDIAKQEPTCDLCMDGHNCRNDEKCFCNGKKKGGFLCKNHECDLNQRAYTQKWHDQDSQGRDFA